jgi:lipoprotein-anchoring transpeptidase ErfK/SrfK
VIIAAGAMVLLAGCNGDNKPGSASGGKTSMPPVPPASVQLSLADGSTDVSPAVPLQISVTGGTLDQVTVVDGAGQHVDGSIAPASEADPAAASSSAGASSSAAPSTGSSSSTASAGSSPSATSPSAGAAEVWTPDDRLDYGTKYTITATAFNSAHKAAKATSTFTTVTPDSTSTPSIGPLDGTTVGVGMPIRVYFDDPIGDDQRADVERHLTVTSSKPTDGAWNWMNDSEVHFRPSTYWPAGTDVTLDADLYGVDLGDGVWGEKNREVSFHVGTKHVSVADAAAHTLAVYDSDRLVHTFPMSAGSSKNPTRNGDHVVLQSYRKIVMDSSTFGLAVDAPGGYRANVEYAVRISNNGEFVHAAPWSVAQQGHSNVSHGCINLSTANAQWFYGWAQPGDIVAVKNSVGPTLSSVDGDIYDWAIPWDQWQAGSALK